ncbi:MAG: hypothetical protein HBSAPP04_00280 [Ignavibacteriaceae bacterium]|nr:MAG: hypothetical protein HBSAPP04_00280 [Ignavibacteriaceae bacterium]
MKTLHESVKRSLATSGIPNAKSTQNHELDLNKRIRECTSHNHFTIPDPWEDYLVLNSDDPFTNLFLVYEDYSSYSDKLIETHFAEIKKFLDRILSNFNSGIEYKSTYPLLNPELAITKIREAKARLSTGTGRKQVYSEIIEKIKAEGKQDLDTLIEALLIDNVLTPDESRHYVNKALTYGYNEAEALEQLNERLTTLGYVQAKASSTNSSLEEKILSTAWMTPEKLRESSVNPENPSITNQIPKIFVGNFPGFILDTAQKVARETDINDVKKTIDVFGREILQKLIDNNKE